MSDRPGVNLPEWYEVVKDVVDTPLTVIWQHDRHLTSEDTYQQIQEVADKLKAMWSMVGTGYPAFLRSGLTSGKHNWRRTCYVEGPEYLNGSIRAICEYSEMVDIFGLPTDTWVLREMLKTSSLFTAFEGMPVARERRYFVVDGEVVGHHPYWPPEAIAGDDESNIPELRDQHRADTDDWREKLEHLNTDTETDLTTLEALTLKVGAVIPGAWSVDWLWVAERGWVLIDMAWAEESFVWWDHPDAPKRGAW